MENSHLYDDIIDLPHHVSTRHPPMPMADRAAQFSPFAALTGYDAAIAETARLTDSKRELSEDEQHELGRRLQELQGRLKTRPTVTLTFFEPDARKAGGSYRTVTGAAKKLDALAGTLELADGTLVPFEDILSLEPAP